MSCIIKKEFNHYFHSLTGYIYAGVFLLLAGFYFVMGNLVSQSGDIKVFFSSFNSVMMFLLPILTMRLFSEERKNRTDELLLTAPISITKLVLGKFFATMLFFLLVLAVTLLYPVTLKILGAGALMDTVGNYLGLILMVGAFIAVGLFVSVLTENQVISAVITYSVLLLLYVLDSVESLSSGVGARLASFVSLRAHYEGFTYGLVDIADIVFYLSFTALFLFFSVYVLEHRRIS